MAWTLTVDELAKATGGKIISPGTHALQGVGTDSRQDLKGRLFVPLKGDRFDGHDYVEQAVGQGAAAVLVHQWKDSWKTLGGSTAFVQVKDTLLALQALARYWRHKHKFKVLGITGSNGKTSTKEFACALLKRKFAVHASKGSFNNHWGVPLSILSADSSHTHLVLEMGMNHSGEIFRLCQIAEPDIVTVTTVGRAHIGELGSQENIAKAKEEIYVACPKAIHIFNMDNEWTMRMQPRSHSQQIRFSAFKPEYEIHIRAQRMNWDGLDLVGHIKGTRGQTWVNVLGRHNVVNLMATAGLALAAGMTPEEIWSGFSEIKDASWGRNQILVLESGARVLFDAYNANPDSFQALYKNIYEMDVPGRKYLIAGDMRELGSFAASAHEEVGERAASVGFEGIWFIGEHAQPFTIGVAKAGKPKLLQHSADVDPAMAKEFLSHLKDGDLVAIKGSRGMALERVLKDWPLKTPLGTKP